MRRGRIEFKKVKPLMEDEGIAQPAAGDLNVLQDVSAFVMVKGLGCFFLYQICTLQGS